MIYKGILWDNFAAGLGFHQYGLAGETSGSSSRLGSVNALAIGISKGQRMENWKVNVRAAVLLGNSQSIDTKAELGYLLNPKAHGGWYLGSFFGYTNYRGFVTNKLNARELFTESRNQLGLQFGYAGAESDSF